jgi:hypothetical protein
MQAASLALLAMLAVSRADIVYPMFKQCDPRWANNSMGVDGALAADMRAMPRRLCDCNVRCRVAAGAGGSVAGPGERSTICGEVCARPRLGT